LEKSDSGGGLIFTRSGRSLAFRVGSTEVKQIWGPGGERQDQVQYAVSKGWCKGLFLKEMPENIK